MPNRSLYFFLFLGLLSCTDSLEEETILSYEIDHSKSQVAFFLMDSVTNSNYYSFQSLSEHLSADDKKMTFALNGGMFNPDYQPVGLYIEDSKTLSPLNIQTGEPGNFYLSPNGIYGIKNDNTPFISTTQEFTDNSNIKYATQSGPMLLIDGKTHSKFKQGSENLNIRNGVGILPNGNSIFAISIEEINFYDFAKYFKDKGCENALYLDGFVSKMYLPAKGEDDLGGEFGVIIAEYE
ncbi:MAG: hypothetical protein ACI857_000485 [Arenicella sp.]|jgi:uncharacterized protein YigE (DUF2233 family)